MKPSSFSIRAISSFTFESGTSTFWCLAPYAFLTRVSMSAIGSVIRLLKKVLGPESEVRSRDSGHRTSNLGLQPFLPTRLCYARDVPFESQPAEAYSAKRELAKIASTASASPAAVVNTGGEHVEI